MIACQHDQTRFLNGKWKEKQTLDIIKKTFYLAHTKLPDNKLYLFKKSIIIEKLFSYNKKLYHLNYQCTMIL